MIRFNINVVIGVILKRKKLVLFGEIGFFRINFELFVRGCNNLNDFIILGFFLCCIKVIILCLVSIKKVIFSRSGRIILSILVGIVMYVFDFLFIYDLVWLI